MSVSLYTLVYNSSVKEIPSTNCVEGLKSIIIFTSLFLD